MLTHIMIYFLEPVNYFFLFAVSGHLKRLFVDVDVISSFNLFGFAKQDEVLEEEDVPEVLPASAPHDELVLTPQLSLFLQIHL